MKQTLLLIALVLFTLSSASAQTKYKEIDNISYVSPNDTSSYRQERCKLDIYYPTDSNRPFKTIVWFHGGGLTEGHKDIPGDLKNQGVAVVAPNYRLYPRAHNPQYTEDAAEAVAWVVKHIKEYGGDPGKVYISGHSAGGYLTLMLCFDKDYLGKFGVDADSIKGYFPIGGQTATHYTIRRERGISFTSPIVDKYAPLNNVRKLSTRLVLITGDRKLEQMGRYEENLYLKSVLEGIGNDEIPIHELSGFDHGGAGWPGRILMMQYISKDK
ncbi:alpha/beta hydrolase [Hallella mizrahii]|uniref:Alpha/beta hydrolase n=1 Tax=Hallella mizrahii TaxID=2606637 RepID=A0A7K0KI17_9BACT|nr:alpha/beta hydrolase [Hallella mizrahii]MST85581.1 alpha/beta hydrolase [Hallella mizrahii]